MIDKKEAVSLRSRAKQRHADHFLELLITGEITFDKENIWLAYTRLKNGEVVSKYSQDDLQRVLYKL